MAHSEEIKQKVRSAFIHERLPLEAASSRFSVSYNTARSWKKKARLSGDDWDKARSASRMAEGGLGEITSQVLEDFAILFQSTIEDIKNSKSDGIQKAAALSQLSDAYSKTMKAAGMGNPTFAKLAVAMKVLEELAKFIKEHHPEDLPLFAAILEQFGTKVNEVFS